MYICIHVAKPHDVHDEGVHGYENFEKMVRLVYILIIFVLKYFDKGWCMRLLFSYSNNDIIAARSLCGGMHPQLHENISKNKAIWCVLVYILMRFEILS